MSETLDKVGWLTDARIAGTVKIIMDEQSMSLQDAMDSFFSSCIYEAISDAETGLYLESPSYLYELYLKYQAE